MLFLSFSYHSSPRHSQGVNGVGGLRPENQTRSADLLMEIQSNAAAPSWAPLPIVVGGYFNLIFSGEDTNNANIDSPRMHLFNNVNASMELRDVAISRTRYTWTNKLLSLVSRMLDWVFRLLGLGNVYPSIFFPLATWTRSCDTI